MIKITKTESLTQKKAYNREASTTDDLSGTPGAKQGFGWGN